MKKSYKTVVGYVKNLFPGVAPIAPSDNPQLDAMVINQLSTNKFYTVASDKHRYWYCFVDDADIPVARYVLRSNGVKTTVHNSHYFFEREPVLRVRTAYLDKNPNARKFVESVMELGLSVTSEKLVQTRIEQIRQKVK